MSSGIKKIMPSSSYGGWLLVSAPSTAGSATYAFLGAVTETAVALYDTKGGTAIVDGAGKTFMSLDTKHTGGTNAFDYVLTVYGLDVLPATFTYAAYRYAASEVVPPTRITCASATGGAGLVTVPHQYRYYLWVITSTGVAAGGNVVFGAKFWSPGDALQ